MLIFAVFVVTIGYDVDALSCSPCGTWPCPKLPSKCPGERRILFLLNVKDLQRKFYILIDMYTLFLLLKN